MTSGVYPRKPGNNVGKKPMFDKDEILSIKAGRAKGHATKFLAAFWHANEKTIRHVLNGTGAYKELK